MKNLINHIICRIVIIIAASSFLMSGQLANAESGVDTLAQNLQITKWFWVNGQNGLVTLTTDPMPTDACQAFTFDGTTDTGKEFFLLLLTAERNNLPVAIWYVNSDCSGSGGNPLEVTIRDVGFTN